MSTATTTRGRLSDFDGTADYDEQQPEESSVEVTIRAASIDTNERDRDAHLRSSDLVGDEVKISLSAQAVPAKAYQAATGAG